MSYVTGTAYGLPPISMQDMSVGAAPSAHPLTHPAGKIIFPVYAVVLIGIAILYFWKGRK